MSTLEATIRRSLPALALGLCLAACASGNKNAPPPVLTVAAAHCDAAPNMAGAIALAFDPKNETPLPHIFDANAPCLAGPAGEKSVYAVFVLPPSDTPYSVSVASAPVGYGLFVPHVQMLDDKGAVLRQFQRDAFIFRNNDLSLIFRSHAVERYLVIASDPAGVGQSISRVQEQTSVTPIIAGPVMFNEHTGTDATTNYVYAHSGQVTITLSAIPSVK